MIRPFRPLPCLMLASLAVLAPRPAAAAPVATLTLEPASPTGVASGATVLFDVYLRGFAPDAATQPIIAFGLDVSASDQLLTDGGTDFSRFSFALAPGLAGVLGGLDFDADLADDGRVQFGADLPPFGTEPGLLASAGDTRLGTLSVVAPALAGTFAVALRLDASDPLLSTFLLVDDGSPLGLVLPGDGTLSVVGGNLSVATAIPEPSSWLLAVLGLTAPLAAGTLRRKLAYAAVPPDHPAGDRSSR